MIVWSSIRQSHESPLIQYCFSCRFARFADHSRSDQLGRKYRCGLEPQGLELLSSRYDIVYLVGYLSREICFTTLTANLGGQILTDHPLSLNVALQFCDTRTQFSGTEIAQVLGLVSYLHALSSLARSAGLVVGFPLGVSRQRSLPDFIPFQHCKGTIEREVA